MKDGTPCSPGGVQSDWVELGQLCFHHPRPHRLDSGGRGGGRACAVTFALWLQDQLGLEREVHRAKAGLRAKLAIPVGAHHHMAIAFALVFGMGASLCGAWHRDRPVCNCGLPLG